MPTGTTLDARCEENGERACDQSRNVLLECTDDVWTLVESCPRGMRCDSSDPQCSPILAGCERLTPGSSFCDGQTRITCGPDLVTQEEEPCPGKCTGGKCISATCGDGIAQNGETCDDGNTDDDDACTSACEAPRCGDAIVSAAEECDDANDSDTDGCTTECTLAVCGDGFVEDGEEECDDGNDDETDECLASCRAVVCGDSIVSGSEECDDGNYSDTDDCPSTCTTATCGDGFVWEGRETCDDANSVNDDLCTDRCTAEPISLTLGGDHTCALFQNQTPSATTQPISAKTYPHCSRASPKSQPATDTPVHSRTERSRAGATTRTSSSGRV
jgi:cysteine-rich repeat protein